MFCYCSLVGILYEVLRIDEQYSDSDTDLSLPISISTVTQDFWIPDVHTVEGIMQYIPVWKIYVVDIYVSIAVYW